MEEAIADAIAWVEPLVDRHHPPALIGVEVSTTSGGGFPEQPGQAIRRSIGRHCAERHLTTMQ